MIYQIILFLFAITNLLHKKRFGHEVQNEYVELNDFDLISAHEHLLLYRLSNPSVSLKILKRIYYITL